MSGERGRDSESRMREATMAPRLLTTARLNCLPTLPRPARVEQPREADQLGSPTMHYPHRISRITRKRAIGFRARMKTKNGRKLLNRKRRVGRSLNVADKRRG